MQTDRYGLAKQRTLSAWTTHEKLVRRALFNLGVRGDTVSDLVQETFERLFVQLIEKDEPQSYPKWLVTVALNLGRDFFDRAANKNHFPLDNEESDFDDNRGQNTLDQQSVVEALSTSDDFSDKNLVTECVKKKLKIFREKYPKKYTAICFLKDGYSNSEIALIIGRTEHATRQFLTECRKALKPFLEECWY
jgi:RNA polymerase sigma factor (sigma-70 family)